MKTLPKQRGQAVVEFSLILPLFALLLFAMVYIGFFLMDYLTLNSAAEVAARDAKINSGTVSTEIQNNIKDTQLFLPWYELDSNSPKVTENSTEFVTVMIQANWKDSVDKPFLLSFMPDTFTVKKSAYKGGD